MEGSPRPLIVKYAEDQHKKKELNRLHNLSMGNSYRTGNPMMQGHPLGMGMNGMGMGMGGHSSHQPQPHHHQPHPHHQSGNMMGGGMPMTMTMNNNGMNMMNQRREGPKGNEQQGGPLGSPYFYQPQSMANMYSNPQPSPPPPMPMVHSPVGNNRMMFGPPPTNPGTPPGMGGMGGEFSGRRTPRAPKNKSFGFDNQAPPPGVGLQPANVGNWFPPQQLPFMPPNAGLPPPPALHPNSSSMGMPSPRFFPMQSPQDPQLGEDNKLG